MDEKDLLSLRVATMSSQATMAEAMGVPLRTYEDLEAGRSKVRGVHLKAAQLAAMELAVHANDPAAIPPSIGKLADAAAKLRNSKLRLFYDDELEKRFPDYGSMMEFVSNLRRSNRKIRYALVEDTGKTISGDDLDWRDTLS